VFATPAQTGAANASRTAAEEALGRRFVTPVRAAARFWPAEAEHQDYAERHPARYEAYRIGCRRTESLRRVWGEAAVT
jgi:peptide-methionine (S)-S-oxide reductase